MAVISTGSTMFQANFSNLRRPLDTVDFWKNFRTRVSEKEHLCCGSLAKDKQMSGKCFSDNSYLSAILDRQ